MCFLGIITIQYYGGSSQTCCGFIDYHNTECHREIINIDTNPYKSYKISTQNIDGQIICTMNDIICDSYYFNNTNEKLTLSQCIENSHYNISGEDICSEYVLNGNYGYDYYGDHVDILNFLDVAMILYTICHILCFITIPYGMSRGCLDEDSPGLDYALMAKLGLDLCIYIFIIIFAPFYLWSLSMDYVNTSVVDAYDLDIVCGRTDIIWISDSPNIPWYLMWYGPKLWLWTIYIFIEIGTVSNCYGKCFCNIFGDYCCDYFCGHCCSKYSFICDKAYCKSYMYKRQGKQRTVIQWIIFILFAIQICLYSYVISIYNQPVDGCCGIIDYENTDCYKGDFDSIINNPFNSFLIASKNIDGASLCVIDDVRCDAFTINNTNVILTLSDCIADTGYEISSICSTEALSGYGHTSSFMIGLTILNSFILLYILWRMIHILLLHFGCLKDGYSCFKQRELYGCCDVINVIKWTKGNKFNKYIYTSFHPHCYYFWIDLFIILLFIVITPIFIWLFGFNYNNEPVQIEGENTIDDKLNMFCGTADIIWISPISSSIPWYFNWFGVTLWIFILVIILEYLLLKNHETVNQDYVLQRAKNKHYLHKKKYKTNVKEKYNEIEMENKTVLSQCTSFEEDNKHEIIKNCDYLKRLSHIIEYYEKLRIKQYSDINESDKDEFVEKCTEQYNGNILDDIYHIQQKHEHQYVQINKEMQEKMPSIQPCKLSAYNEDCLSITRHYTERDRYITNEYETKYDNSELDYKYGLYINVMDNVHMLFNHMIDLGFRVNSETEKHNNTNHHNRFDRICRYKSSDNKYNLSIANDNVFDANHMTEYNLNNHNQHIKTWIDTLFEVLENDNIAEEMVDDLFDIIINHEYDTDGLLEDTSELKQSNISNLTDTEIMASILKAIKSTTGTNISLFLLLYFCIYTYI